MSHLIGLAAAKKDSRAGFIDLHVLTVNCDQLGPAERSREAYQQDGGIPEMCCGFSERGDDRRQLIAGQRGNAPLRSAEPPADASECQPDEFRFGRVTKSPLNVRGVDAGEPAGKRCHAQYGCMVRQVASDLLRCGREISSPQHEMTQIALVSALRVWRRGGGDEFDDFGIATTQNRKWSAIICRYQTRRGWSR